MKKFIRFICNDPVSFIISTIIVSSVITMIVLFVLIMKREDEFYIKCSIACEEKTVLFCSDDYAACKGETKYEDRVIRFEKLGK